MENFLKKAEEIRLGIFPVVKACIEKLDLSIGEEDVSLSVLTTEEILGERKSVDGKKIVSNLPGRKLVGREILDVIIRLASEIKKGEIFVIAMDPIKIPNTIPFLEISDDEPPLFLFIERGVDCGCMWLSGIPNSPINHDADFDLNWIFVSNS